MIIKQPSDDNALRNLIRILDNVEDRLRNCISNKHDAAVILYVSSLVISPRVVYQHTNLLDRLMQIVRVAPYSVVCVVRTNTSHCFHGARHLARLQKSAINRLRSNCYLVLYSPKQEFLNHAKFLIYSQVCFSERIVHNAKYYGSTNITTAGLSHYGYRVGNYEEFAFSPLKAKYNVGWADVKLINEVEELITNKARLYTDPQYFRRYISVHLDRIQESLGQVNRVLSGTTLEDLFDAYLESATTYFQTLALLDHIPGKNLTSEITEKLISIAEETGALMYSPLELSAVIPSDIRNIEQINEDINLTKEELQSALNGLSETLRKSSEFLNKIQTIKNIQIYLDELEQGFARFIDENYSKHTEKLERAKAMVHGWGEPSFRAE